MYIEFIMCKSCAFICLKTHEYKKRRKINAFVYTYIFVLIIIYIPYKKCIFLLVNGIFTKAIYILITFLAENPCDLIYKVVSFDTW